MFQTRGLIPSLSTFLFSISICHISCRKTNYRNFEPRKQLLPNYRKFANSSICLCVLFKEMKFSKNSISLAILSSLMDLQTFHQLVLQWNKVFYFSISQGKRKRERTKTKSLTPLEFFTYMDTKSLGRTLLSHPVQWLQSLPRPSSGLLMSAQPPRTQGL